MVKLVVTSISIIPRLSPLLWHAASHHAGATVHSITVAILYIKSWSADYDANVVLL